MTKDPAKDFAPIADDYVFFETHATEPEQDARAYAERLAALVLAEGPIRLLDFGCGSGTFTARFLQQIGWPPARLRLTLVEPAETVRRKAVERLAGMTAHPVLDAATLPGGSAGSFDVVLSNHALYYVPALPNVLAGLIDGLAPAGVFVTALASRTNALVAFWLAAFRALGREVPYNTAEDVEAALQGLAVAYQKQWVPYDLIFPDTEENRLRIVRFLLWEHLPRLEVRPLLDLFDAHAHTGQIVMRTGCEHFTVRSERVPQ